MYSIEFQRAALHLLCVNREFQTTYGGYIREEYLDTQPLRLILREILRYMNLYNKEIEHRDLLTLIDDMMIRNNYSIDTYTLLRDEVNLIFRTILKNEQFVSDQIIKFIRKQEMKIALGKAIDIAEKEDDGYERILKIIDEAVSVGLGNNKNGLTFDDLKNFITSYRSYYSPEKLTPIGLPTYDRALLGGIAPGEIHCIQACPKTGKSTFLVNIGVNALLRGIPVFHITLELKEIDVLAKYAVRLSGLKYSEIIDGNIEDYTNRMQQYHKYKPKLFIKYWTANTINVLTIRSWISRIRAEKNINPGLILIDYDDLLLPVHERKFEGSMYLDAGEIYTDMIGLADYFSAPVVTAAQPNRNAWEKQRLGELIYSYDLAHSALKAHHCFTLSSLNFGDNANDGIFYLDLTRRGESGIKIKIKRDLSYAFFQEVNSI